MKRLFLLFIAMLLSLSLLMFTACDDKENPDDNKEDENNSPVIPGVDPDQPIELPIIPYE